MVASFCLATVIGCGSASDEAPPSSSLPSPLQDEAKKVEANFVAALQAKNFQDAASLSTQRMASQLPKDGLGWGKGIFKPLSDSKGWEVDLIDSPNDGKKIVVHAHFTGEAEGVYRTNFILVQEGKDLKVDSIVPPSKGSLAKGAAGGSMRAAP